MSNSPRPLELLTAAGPWDGPSYRYRDAEIHCCPGAHVCCLVMHNHPLNGITFGVPGTITPLVDMWLDEGCQPQYLRQKRTL